MKVAAYIQETPAKMHQVVDKSTSLFQEVKQAAFDRIILTGSGSSFHAALQVKPLLQRLLKIEIEALYPFQVTSETFAGSHHTTLLIGLSQGGSSYSTYRAMLTAKEHNVKIASMAGAEQVLIDELADYVLTVFCGEEKAGPKTKGFTTTKLNLMLFGLHVALERKHITQEDFNKQLTLIDQAIAKFDHVYQTAEVWVKANQETLAAASDLRVVGTADLYGDTLESALKMLETLRTPVTGYEFEEFIHGIYNAINENSTLIIFNSGKEERVSKLIEVLSDWTSQVFVITNQQVTKWENSIYLPIDENNPYDMLFLVIPIQLICALVPELKGINPAIPKDRQFHQKLNSKKL
ncbi:SIS domain-containing protein [Amphibacillus marinus]|uniref:SIS domain-containing protein n=1 Tax=Amphibacillus marinus TaxID=872970 RepID=A0A1H8IWD2_9BACI|nr:SIS domain-containing protein [Amphibacillus marinus]SEN72894.1 SIS domain-containing protein [Amphibacillus marinus]